jgi:hypothetical protein
MSPVFKKIKSHFKEKFFLFLIVIFGFVLRTYGLNWDQGFHLHPDERFLTMVVSDIKLSPSLGNYFDTATSVFNPDNNNYHFYVYGNLPLLITKSIAKILNYDGYDKIYLVGRVLSAIFDSLIIILVYLIAFELFKNHKISLLSSLVYTFAVLPIQQAHFFTVDSCTVFFATWSIYLILHYLKTKNLWSLISSGLVFGLTLSSKTSIGITLPLILIIIAFSKFRLSDIFFRSFIFLCSVFIAFRIFQPYAFNGLLNLSPTFIGNVKLASLMITGGYDYPPNLQWTGTLPLIHPFINIFFYGLGPIISLLAIAGLIIVFTRRSNWRNLSWFLVMGYLAIIFGYQGIQWAKYMRYFYPLYPFFAIFAGVTLSHLSFLNRFPKITLFLLIIAWPLAFINIYSHPNSRIAASFWIYQNLPFGSKITSEIWDDSLPLDLPRGSFSLYQNISLPLYDPDTPNKWQQLNPEIGSANYLILTSNRLWGSIPKAPTRYPISSQFYQNLFQQKRSFQHLVTFASYPGFSLPFLKKCYYFGPTNYPGLPVTWFSTDSECTYPGIYLRDDTAEESFTVYDHPQVIIFAKVK